MKLVAKTTLLVTSLTTLFLTACASTTDLKTESTSSKLSTTSPIDLDFTAIAPVASGKYQAVNCNTDYQLGSTSATTKIADLRFYITNLRVMSKDGKTLPVRLTSNDFQQSDVGLIDLEDGSGGCAERGDNLVNRKLVGQVPGDYDESDIVGVSFDLAVPSKKNHTLANSPKTTAPLDIQGMAWSWQAGRKFTKIELAPVDKVTMRDGTKAGIYNLHLGKTGCVGNADRNETVNCKFNNIAHVTLGTNGNLADEVVVLNLAKVFEQSDITQDMGKKAGCMSFKGDEDCASLFSAFGLSHMTGEVEGDQTVFSLMKKQ